MLRLSDNNTITSSIDDSCFSAFSRIDLISDKKLLVTEGQHVVSIHNMDDETGASNDSRCFTFSQIKQLSCPVVYDRIRKKLVAVLSQSEVRIFSPDEEIDDGERYKFHADRKIAAIISNPCGEPVVLFMDSSISLLSSALTIRSDPPERRSSRLSELLTDIVRVKAIVSQKRTGFVIDVLVVHRPASDVMVCDRHRMDQETEMVERGETIHLPIDCLIFGISDSCAFGALTSDGQVIVIKDCQTTSLAMD